MGQIKRQVSRAGFKGDPRMARMPRPGQPALNDGGERREQYVVLLMICLKWGSERQNAGTQG